MTGSSSSRTVGVFIECSPAFVVEYVSNPLNLPHWASAFCKSVRKVGADWQVETPQGQVFIRFVLPNAHGVLDHHVLLLSGQEVYVPMRAIPYGKDSEVLITLLRSPDMSDMQFDEDAAMVEHDLQSLKSILERV